MTKPDRNTCRWCYWRHPVATMVRLHEAKCVARPNVRAA